MTAQGWLVAVLLVAAATAVAWPLRVGRSRQSAVLGPSVQGSAASASHAAGRAHGRRANGARTAARAARHVAPPVAERPLPTRPPGRRDATHPDVASVPVDGRRPRAALSLSPVAAGAPVARSAGRNVVPLLGAPSVDPAAGSVGPVAGGPAVAAAADQVHGGPVAALFRVLGLPDASKPAESPTTGIAVRGSRSERVGVRVPRPDLLLVVLVGGGTGAVLGGPVAAVGLAAYGVLAARAARRRRARQLAERARWRDLDQLCALAADLRAGLPVALGAVDGPHRIARLARAAVRLADRTGAPLADLLERVEADARAADRGLAAAAAQAAGARATAWLLAVLPFGGIGLGYAIGVDPIAVLLHTTIGGGCALAAVALQIGGLLWAERLGAPPGRDD
ncbi:type II secretion system F family protein [Micromonospora sp. SL4-19]|uniref:type II secretion system F family protein n=1 Tax=Micromonospora sp. SL4-19 TaxID=3399129 RepID=UPI003A4D36EE